MKWGRSRSRRMAKHSVLDLVALRNERGKFLNDELVEYFHKRAKIESNYSKELLKLSASMREYPKSSCIASIFEPSDVIGYNLFFCFFNSCFLELLLCFLDADNFFFFFKFKKAMFNIRRINFSKCSSWRKHKSNFCNANWIRTWKISSRILSNGIIKT